MGITVSEAVSKFLNAQNDFTGQNQEFYENMVDEVVNDPAFQARRQNGALLQKAVETNNQVLFHNAGVQYANHSKNLMRRFNSNEDEIAQQVTVFE